MWRFKLNEEVPIVRGKTHELEEGWRIIGLQGDVNHPRYVISREDQSTGQKAERSVAQSEIEFAIKAVRRAKRTGAEIPINIPAKVAKVMQDTVLKRPSN